MLFNGHSEKIKRFIKLCYDESWIWVPQEKFSCDLKHIFILWANFSTNLTWNFNFLSPECPFYRGFLCFVLKNFFLILKIITCEGKYHLDRCLSWNFFPRPSEIVVSSTSHNNLFKSTPKIVVWSPVQEKLTQQLLVILY